MVKKPTPAPEGEILEAIEELKSAAEGMPRAARKSPTRKARRDKDSFYAHELRGKSREFLDLLRSFVTVAVISYAASKSTTWYLSALAYAAKFALGTYALSYIVNYMEWFERKRASKWVDALFSITFVLVAYIGLHLVFMAVNITIDELIRVRM